MTYRAKLHTVDDLIKYLSNSELKGRPLGQVITVAVMVGGKEVWFNQLDNFTWNSDNNELEIET